ncbi:MAG: hypothetical protein KF708_00600 [Pirellulales bacterium]|nr:hypothetical protein [Pirellulales bacterium]
MSRELTASREVAAATTVARVWSDRSWLAIAAGVYALLICGMFGNLLLRGDRLVSADWTSEIRILFYHLRFFSFRELASGNLPLWNPHIFSGIPLAANFQAALFYPPNGIFLLLPTARAINVSMALHTFLLGWFTFVWLRGRHLSPIASLVGGAVAMFSGPYFAFVYAGNLANLSTMVWAPLILRAIDGVLDGAQRPWALVGSAAVAMQVLAGHPQYVYYTALAAGLYFALSWPGARKRKSAVVALVAIYGGGAALAAIQLVPGLALTENSVRGGGHVPYHFASSLSFPPENLVTLVAPGFFGEMPKSSYWGKATLWEMNCTFGVSGLMLALYGVAYGRKDSRRFVLAGLALVMLVLALGSNTPLHGPLYELLPGFASFRASAKFAFPAVLCLIALMSIGLDALLRIPVRSPVFPALLVSFAVTCGIAGALVAHSARSGTDGRWAAMLRHVRDQAQEIDELFHRPVSDYESPQFIEQSGAAAGASLKRAAYLALCVALLLVASRWYRPLLYVLAALAVAEVMVVAWSWCVSFPVDDVWTPNLEQYVASQAREARFMDEVNPNEAMSIGGQNVIGHDPAVSRRYAEVFAFAARRPVDELTHYMEYHPQPAIPSAYRLARSHFLVVAGTQSGELMYYTLPMQNPLERLVLVADYVVLTARNDVLQAMSQADFEPTQTVILEREPFSAGEQRMSPGSQPIGMARVVDESTDHVTIEAHLQRPAILLITDSYDPGWKVRALPDSAQPRYELMPADWAFQAIPLQAGQHRFRLEYAPVSLKYGGAVTSLASVGWMALALSCWRRRSA